MEKIIKIIFKIKEKSSTKINSLFKEDHVKKYILERGVSLYLLKCSY